MLRITAAALLLALTTATPECVSPCLRDVVIVVDGTTDMQTDARAMELLHFVNEMTQPWTLAADATRVAIVGNGFSNDIDVDDFYTNKTILSERLIALHYKCSKYGLYALGLDVLTNALKKRYITKFKPRADVQKRIVLFTAETNSAAIAASHDKCAALKNAGYDVDIVAMDSAVDYSAMGASKVIPISSLAVSPAAISDLVAKAVCYDDGRVPSPTIPPCAVTTTSPVTAPPTRTTTHAKTTTPVVTATPPVPTPSPALHMNCSCTPSNIWVDIIVVVDVSASMGDDGLAALQADIATTLMQLTMDYSRAQSVRIGIVTFDKEATIVATLDQFRSMNALIQALYALRASDSVAADIEKALKLAEIAFQSGNRPNAQDVVVLYSSSYGRGGTDDPLKISEQLKESGVLIATVALLQPDETDLVLKLGDLASPRMNFTSTDTHPDVVDELIDAFCQANCFCPSNWEQLSVGGRRFGECLRAADIDAGWTQAMYACNRMHAGSRLASETSREKYDFVMNYMLSMWDTSLGRVKFHVGLSLNETSGHYEWNSGEQLGTFTAWDSGYPNAKYGACVATISTSGFNTGWRNEECLANPLRYVCEAAACDSDHYCASLDG